MRSPTHRRPGRPSGDRGKRRRRTPAEDAGARTEETQEALRRADVALYQAKATRTGVQAWEAPFDARSHENLRLVTELRAALDSSDQLVAFVQPQADGQGGQIVGFEALIRWQHPRRGLLLPGDLLDSADGAGLLPAMTQAMLHQSLAALQLLAVRHPALTVAVNASPTSASSPWTS